MFEQKIMLLDGAMGTMLQSAGLRAGERPETLSLTRPQVVEEIHRAYIEAGSQYILSNTFCANAHKLAGTGFAVEEVVTASVQAALRACRGTKTRVCLDIGPIGELLAPLGTLSFREAYDLFAQMVKAGARAGAQAIFLETFSDLGEIRAAVLAAKEHSDLPVFASMTFESGGRTFLGCQAGAAAMTLSGLGVSAVGVNCSLGPREVEPILREMRKYTDLPLILKPNAGLPDPATGAYAMGAEEFAALCEPFAGLGVGYMGGCCGTTPDFIRALRGRVQGKATRWDRKKKNGICSPGRVLLFDGDVHPIGERINPTGKSVLAQALRDGDMNEVQARAISQEEAGAQILDINVGVPGLDEAAVMEKVVAAVSGTVMLPLQIDSSNPEALEAGLRLAPGKCLVNSVNASRKSLDAVLPLVKKYGAAVVGLTLGEHGLPATAEERLGFARTILEEADRYGIPREDVAIDCLTMTVSAQQEQAGETLKALMTLGKDWGLQTVLGVSNISFGLPERQLVTQTFLAQALACGLTLPIINPNQKGIMDTVDAARVLLGTDRGSADYVERHARAVQAAPKAESVQGTLEEAILRGQCAEAAALSRSALERTAPLELAESELIPALDKVGTLYESGRIFLPQLMNAAKAAGAAFDEVRKKIAESGDKGEKKGPVVLATVQGDIHDIGKNIVRTVLENYGFQVIDLGRDVPPEEVVRTARESHARMVGLSALMTTTVPAMKKTIQCLREAGLDVPVMVGGAVLTPDYAREIGADYYARDAKQSADIARDVIG